MVHTRQTHRFVLFLLFALMANGALCQPPQGPEPSSRLTQGAWRAVQPGETPDQALAAARLGDFHRFDPSRMTTIPRGDHGAWVVLYPAPPGLQGPRVISIPAPPFGKVTLYGPEGPLGTASITTRNPEFPAQGRIAFLLPEGVSPTTPILLRFEPSPMLDMPVVFDLQTQAAFRRTDTLWLVMASASIAVMLAMAIVALCFAIMLGDATFAWYALFVSAYAGLQSVQTGFLFNPLGLDGLAHLTLPIGITLTAVSVISAVLFMVRFCDLQRYAPWLRNLLLAVAAMVTMIAMLRLIDLRPLRVIVQNLLNPLIAVSSGLMIVAGSVALVRGSRTALFFLLGWLPLLVITALSSAQVDGALPDVNWLSQASMAIGAIEALVLAIGLADRTLNLRRDHNRARELADRDPLTGILNRRGWIDTAQHFMEEDGVHSLLFMDLDHFKLVNDRFGHASGDHALISVAQSLSTELRPQDLLCRFGGEEFVALLHDTDREQAIEVARRLCRRMQRMEIPLGAKNSILTLSIGVATRRSSDSLSSLIERADAAMYVAKARGRNRVVDDLQVASGRHPMLRAGGTGAQHVETVS